MNINPHEMLRLSFQLGLMTMEAQSVVAMRLFGMAGLWNVTKNENTRMTHEKGPAMLASAFAAQYALVNGADPVSVALAAVKPLRAKTRANASRLTRRGSMART